MQTTMDAQYEGHPFDVLKHHHLFPLGICCFLSGVDLFWIQSCHDRAQVTMHLFAHTAVFLYGEFSRTQKLRKFSLVIKKGQKVEVGDASRTE